MSLLWTERHGAVALVTLNRPERLNATDDALGRAVEDAFLSIGTDSQVRCIVLTGAGGNFCAGGDIDRLGEIVRRGAAALPGKAPNEEDDRFAALTGAPRGTRSRYLLPMAVPQPVIAAIDGACAGAGLVLAVASDVRFATPNAVFAAGFGRRGLVAENGLAFLLSRLIGRGHAADLLISGRRLGVEEAVAMGLINRVADKGAMLEHALAYAADIATNVSPRSARVIKRQLQAVDGAAFFDALQASWSAMVDSVGTADFAEGVASFKEKRPAVFPN